MKHVYQFFLAIAFNFLFTLNLSYAQASFGSISGTVRNGEVGETIPFANVCVDVNGKLIGTTTDFDGVYNLGSIPIGVYTLTFSAIGQKTVIMENILVGENRVNKINATLFTNYEILNNSDWWLWQLPNIPLLNSYETTIGITATRTSSGRFSIHPIY